MRKANGVKSKMQVLTDSVVMITLGYVRIVRVHLKPVATEVRCLTFLKMPNVTKDCGNRRLVSGAEN